MEYFKINPTNRICHGDRYFKVDHRSYESIQVCLSAGEVKKGRGHTFGIYLISRLTVLSNYIAIGYAVPCKKSEYERAFKKVLKYLK